MSAELAARVISPYVDPETAEVMVALAGAESGFRPDARGDRFYGPISCQGYESGGLWQVHMGSHAELLVSMGAPADPCGMLEWLLHPANNARAAARILQIQGFPAWTTFRTGAYLEFLPRARQAVASLEQPVLAWSVAIPLALLLGWGWRRWKNRD